MVLIIILVLILILILVLVVVLILPVIVVLIVLVLVVVLVLILLVITAVATFVLQHLLGVGIVLLGVQVSRITKQGLFVGIHSGFPVLFLDSDVAKIIIIVS